MVGEILEVQTKSKTFGRVLGLPKVTVDSIHLQYSDPQQCLFAVLDEFVKQVEPPPTWRVILEALRNPLINYHRLALKVERKYCLLTHQQDGMYPYDIHHCLHSRQTPQYPTTADLESVLPLSSPQSLLEHGKLDPTEEGNIFYTYWCLVLHRCIVSCFSFTILSFQ